MPEGKAVRLLQSQHPAHGVVHFPGSLGAEGGKHHPFVLPDAKGLPGLGTVVEQELPPDGHSHHLSLFRVPVVLGAFRKADQHPVHPVRHHPGGQPRHGVAFMDAGGEMEPPGGLQRREAGVATSTDDHIRLKILQNTLAFGNGPGDKPRRTGVVPEGVHIQPPAEAGAGEAHKLIARLGHQLHFHVVAADKEDLSLRVAFFPYIGHGNGGIDVSRRSAAGKYHIHTDSSCWSGRPKRRSCRLGRYRPLETARTMPISPRFTASAVPP